MTTLRDGQVWAAAGETRSSRRRLVIATVPGHQGGALYVQAAAGAFWTTAADWRAWAEDNNAVLVDPEPEVDPQPAMDWRGPMPPLGKD